MAKKQPEPFKIMVDLYKSPTPHAIIDNMYSPDELKLIMRELEFLTVPNKLLGPEHTGTARHQNGQPKKQNHGLFLDSVYSMRHVSDILRLNRKIFEPGILEACVNLGPIFKGLRLCNSDSTLLSYYEDGDNYQGHEDHAVLTAVTYFFKEPKKFTGGELVFTEHNHSIEIKNNRTVIFPSFVTHAATPISMETKKPGHGRYCMSQFLSLAAVQH